MAAMLEAVIPGLPKYSPLESAHDVGNVPDKMATGSAGSGGGNNTWGGSHMTYQIDTGSRQQLAEVQTVTTCSGDPLTITVCVPLTVQPGAVLRMTSQGQTVMTSQSRCIHVTDIFSFHMTSSGSSSSQQHSVVFSYDEGAGCPFTDSFVFNVRERKSGCGMSSSVVGTTPPCIPPSAAATTTPPTTTTPTPASSCAHTSTSLPRQPALLSNGLLVLCDTQTDGGDWVIIQRRTQGHGNNNVDFERDWNSYMAGFGDPVGDLNGDHWLGLENIHTLCPPSKPCSLRVDLKDVDYLGGMPVWAEYSTFSLGGFAENYQLSIAGYNPKNSTSLFMAGDAMIHPVKYDSFGPSSNSDDDQNGMAFSTRDRDNDKWSSASCAATYHGGWWFNNCGFANLNSKYGVRGSSGARWFGQPTNVWIYPTFTEMKVRVQHP